MGPPSRVVKVTNPSDIPTQCVDGMATVVYWDICGLAEPIRLALALSGVEWVDVRIDPGDPNVSGEYKKVWFEKKGKVGVRFANLPYFLDAEKKLSQSNAILMHLGKKFDALDEDVDLELAQASDFDGMVTGNCYRAYPDFFNTTNFRPMLEEWALFLEEKKGHEITVGDLKAYEVFRKLKIVSPTVTYPDKIEEFVKKIESAPEIAKYQSSSSYFPRPLNNPHALFK